MGGPSTDDNYICRERHTDGDYPPIHWHPKPATYEDTIEIDATEGEFSGGNRSRPDVSTVFIQYRAGERRVPDGRSWYRKLRDWLKSWTFKEDSGWDHE